MATVSANMLSPSGSNLSTSKTIDTEKRTRLTVTRNSNPWIYSNYPEAIGKNGKGLALAENGYFLNQQTISGTAEVFYSHTNYTGKRLYVGIQAYNGLPIILMFVADTVPNKKVATKSVHKTGMMRDLFFMEILPLSNLRRQSLCLLPVIDSASCFRYA